MADPVTAREPGENTSSGPPPAPRWVKQLGVAALVLAFLFAVLHVIGRGVGHRMHGGDPPGALPAGAPYVR